MKRLIPKMFLLGAFVSQPADPAVSPNRVLELDSEGSFVQRPPDIFNDLTEATVGMEARRDDFSGGFHDDPACDVLSRNSA